MRVLAIAGSLRRGSYNAALLDAAAREAPAGLDWERFDGLREVPAYDEDLDRDPSPAAVRRLRSAIASADAVLIATPEYNGSVPGALKNAIDWASRPYPGNVLREKPIAVVGASTGIFGAVWAQAELRKVLHHAGAHVLEDELSVGTAAQAFDENGNLRDPELARRLAELVGALLRETSAPVELAA